MARSARPSLSGDRVVDAAVELTRERGLDGWTVRDLAAALGTWPNTISYHVGDREAVLDAVVERVVAMVPNPPAELGWQDWFRQLLYPAREVVVRYVGVARRLCRDAATVNAAMPMMDRGVGRLVAAGFGDRAPLAYAALLNTAMLLVALEDDRSLAGRGGGVGAERLLGMPDPPDAGPGWDALRVWLRSWAADPEASRAAVYRYTIEALLAGLETSLTRS